MTPEFWAIITVGAALAGLILSSLRALRHDIRQRIDSLDQRVARLETGQAEIRERLARIEGTLETIFRIQGVPPGGDRAA